MYGFLGLLTAVITLVSCHLLHFGKWVRNQRPHVQDQIINAFFGIGGIGGVIVIVGALLSRETPVPESLVIAATVIVSACLTFGALTFRAVSVQAPPTPILSPIVAAWRNCPPAIKHGLLTAIVIFASFNLLHFGEWVRNQPQYVQEQLLQAFLVGGIVGGLGILAALLSRRDLPPRNLLSVAVIILSVCLTLGLLTLRAVSQPPPPTPTPSPTATVTKAADVLPTYQIESFAIGSMRPIITQSGSATLVTVTPYQTITVTTGTVLTITAQISPATTPQNLILRWDTHKAEIPKRVQARPLFFYTALSYPSVDMVSLEVFVDERSIDREYFFVQARGR